ncbi:cation transporter [Maritimibacter sp. 55A14]|uniref:cation diffusion facilitator family transporter n=1 Tax=Maritimibacter sp. 55A14 TaxID=2174844 RepID=UPI000D61E84D|nr:cation diffusion facilitator family transporter [Maritimibacter sp. 55A14]PWE32249.1 cation transporter [Maritimibacter sp. 55A14]
MPHDHHHHLSPDAGDRRVALAVGVNLALTLVQIAGGIVSGSVALIADAVHNLSDALSLGIAFAARKIARRPSDGTMTFGYGRAEVVAALVNYTTLIVIGLYLVYEAAFRMIDPPGVDGWLVVIVAGVALAVDLVTALLTLRLSRESVNIRAAFLHNLADALGSVAVIAAGSLILLYDWRLVDPLVTLGIAGYILWMAFREIGPVIRILMLGSPPGLETGEVLAEMEAVAGVESVHHLHLWQFSEHSTSLEAHVVVAVTELAAGREIGDRLRAHLADRFGIRHVTLDIESAETACAEPSRIGG